MESAATYHAMRAALDWQIELGADEALSETSINRFELVDKPKAKPAKAATPAPSEPVEIPKVDAVAVAKAAAGGATSLEALHAALAAFEHCELKRGARNMVFGGGAAQSRVMIIGEAPGREEDREGKPFVGRSGQLLDKMLAAIGLSREESVYLSNVLPWRPPQNREAKPEEIAMMRPFVARHVELVAPELIILMGNMSCEAALAKRGITRLRGTWAEAYGLPAIPMFTPEYLLRQPAMKREAWADLLEIKARLS